MLPLVHEGDVVLLARVLPLGDHDRVADAALGAGLLRHEKVA